MPVRYILPLDHTERRGEPYTKRGDQINLLEEYKMKVLIETLVETVTVKENDAEVSKEVTKEIYLESDELQFILKKYNGRTTTDKNGNERDVSEVIGYYTNIHSAISAIVRMKVKQTTATNLQELSEDIHRIDGYIKRMFEVEIGAGKKLAV